MDALRNYPTPHVDTNNLEETVKGAIELVSRTQANRRTSFQEFYIAQLRFMKWKVWAVQVLIVLGMGVFLRNFIQVQADNVQIVMLASITAPLLIIAGIHTITRSLSCHMLEIELSTRHLLEKVTLVRMSLLGMADLLGLAFLAILLSAWAQLQIELVLLYFLVPFNLTCFGCLWLMNRVRTTNSGYYCLIYCCLVELVQSILSFMPSLGLFESSVIYVWQGLLILSAIGIVLEIHVVRKTHRNLESATRMFL